MSQQHRFTVPEGLAGSRLDRCLAALHGGWTRSHVRRLIDQGRVVVNEGEARPAMVVRTGDRVVVDEPEPEPTELAPERMALDLIHEDHDLLVLAKPAGLVIHPAAGRRAGTLVNALLDHCPELSRAGGAERPGIVHRLDRDTSGVMVVAKTERAHVALALAFRRRLVTKTYLAVCYGVPAQSSGTIDAPIGRHPRHRQQMAVVRDGRPARTLYLVEERFRDTALVSLRPVTGRTHQIRVHMAHLGHALVGDPTYAGRQWRNLADPRHRAACQAFPRQALHAWRLGFVHPTTGRPETFEAAPPADFQELVESLRR